MKVKSKTVTEKNFDLREFGKMKSVFEDWPKESRWLFAGQYKWEMYDGTPNGHPVEQGVENEDAGMLLLTITPRFLEFGLFHRRKEAKHFVVVRATDTTTGDRSRIVARNDTQTLVITFL